MAENRAERRGGDTPRTPHTAHAVIKQAPVQPVKHSSAFLVFIEIKTKQKNKRSRAGEQLKNAGGNDLPGTDRGSGRGWGWVSEERTAVAPTEVEPTIYSQPGNAQCDGRGAGGVCKDTMSD